MPDPAAWRDPALLVPAAHAAAVTPSDVTLFDPPTRWLYVNGAGNLVVTTLGGETGVVIAVQAGARLPVRVTKILAATTATGITRYW